MIGRVRTRRPGVGLNARQIAASVMSTLEGAWFSLCLVGALMLVRR
jgi:hypothetical protein